MDTERLNRLKPGLDALAADVDVPTRLAADPVGLVHAYPDAADREVAALVAALLAFGNVKAIRNSVRRVLDVLGERPSVGLQATSYATLRRRLADFRHRVYRGEDVARLLANARTLRAKHGSLGGYFASEVARHGPGEALARFADALRGTDPSRGLAHLVPDPRKGSASKRLHLYLRWMVRPADGVDLGLWPLPASGLVIPVDVHVLRIARNLGLTKRADASSRTAHEITDALRVLDADDPVRYDFAICHLGVSRACPSRREDAVCGRCVLRDVCVAYADQSRKKGTRRASSRRSVSRASKPLPRSS